MVSVDTPGGARAIARCDLLGTAPYSDLPDGLLRAYLTSAHAVSIETVNEWMRAAGMTTRIDPAGNLIGRYEGRAPDAPAVLIGSHIDSVSDGGRYDGPLGIMLGIECVDRLSRTGRRLEAAIEVIAFGDEEGSRFPAPMLTSRAVAGTFTPDMLETADSDGTTVTQALAERGLDAARFADAARPSGSIRAYVEAHIEQGPALEAAGLAVGTVTGIAAQRRYRITVTGRAGHAGTTAMDLRRDALAAAAEIVLAVERVAQRGSADLVATVGTIAAAPGAANVVPGAAVLSLDVRAATSASRDKAAGAIAKAVAKIAARRETPTVIEPIHAMEASPCDPALIDLMDRALADTGHPVHRLVSGAGHDAMVMAALCPTAMLFVRCAGGVSHNRAEAVDVADVEAALDVLCRFVDLVGDSHD